MRISGASACALFSLWMASCATAENQGLPPDSGAARGGAAGSQGSSGQPGSAGAIGPVATGGTGPQTGAGGASFGGGGASSASGGSPAAGGAANTSGASNSEADAGSGGQPNAGGGSPGGGRCALAPTVRLEYQTGGAGDTISGKYRFVNLSALPIPVVSLKIRYFFSSEKTSPWVPQVYSAQIDGGSGYRALTGAKLAVLPLSPQQAGADSYAELTFPAGTSLEMGATASVSWAMQPTSYAAPLQVQADDYSFDASAIAFKVSDRIAVYQGDELVAGCVPGASGDTGVGGTSAAAGAGPDNGPVEMGGAGGAP